MTQEKFQELVIEKFDKIGDLLRKNEEDHGNLSTEIESVRTEVESVRTNIESVRTEVESVRTNIESVRTELHKSINTFLRWTIGAAISVATLAFIMAKYVT